MDLRTKTARSRLAARSSAYTQKLEEGKALGYRRRRADQPGRWMLRTYTASGKYAFEVLGAAGDLADADGVGVLTYAQALDAALGRNMADPTRITVEQALTEWGAFKIPTASSEKQVKDILSEVRRASKPFTGLTLKSITARQINAWMTADRPPSKGSANRRLTVLKAALRRAADLSE